MREISTLFNQIKWKINMNPKSGTIYTLSQVENDLNLRDSPHLMIEIGEGVSVIQNSHFSGGVSDLHPELAESEWKYLRETDEWIPLFKAMNPEEVLQYMTVEEYTYYVYEDDTYWVVPVGAPRSQES